MKDQNVKYFGSTRLWWVVLCVGILLILGGFAYWLWPVEGFMTSSILFGWLLVLAGIVQLCVASGPARPRSWGWWIAGGIIDLFIGFMLVRSLPLAESVFPIFLAIIFIFWGIEAFIGAAVGRHGKYWWLGLINGILMCVIGYFFFEGSMLSNTYMVSFLTSLAFIYWGFTVAIAGYEMKPLPEEK